jgi:hypothetical protein
MIWLAGNSFYGRKQIFEPEFLAWLSISSCRTTSCRSATASMS